MGELNKLQVENASLRTENLSLQTKIELLEKELRERHTYNDIPQLDGIINEDLANAYAQAFN